MPIYRKYIKRGIDVAASALGLLCLSPVLAAITVWLHFANRGACAFFRQDRPGLHGNIFRLIKFKTMTDRRDAAGHLLPDADRLTPVGRFVRSTSLDELPQLWNVLRGDMSLIGPRPLLPRYMPWYTDAELHRHDVRPGITGWAQCHGRNAVSWDEKLAMDVWYVNHISFMTDVRVILKTIKSVIKRESIEVTGVEALDVCRMKEGKIINDKNNK